VTLQLALLRHCGAPSCDTAALQVATLRHYKLRRYDATTRVVALLQLTWLHCCNVVHGCNATSGYDVVALRVAATLWRSNSRGCDVVALRVAATCGALARVAATLWRCVWLQWRCNSRGCGAAALQRALLRLYSSRYYGATTRYNTAALRVAVTLGHYSSRVFFFFFE